MPKRRSGNKISGKRVSKKKTSGKRRSTRRVSKKKTSGKRRSTKRTYKKKSPLVYKNMTLKDLQKRFKKIDTYPKTYEKTESGNYPITWNISITLKDNETYKTGTSILLYSKNNGYRLPTHDFSKTLTLKKSEIRKKVRNIIKEIQKDKNLKKINKVFAWFSPFLYHGKPEKGEMLSGITIYYS